MKVIITGENGYISNKTCEFLNSIGHEAKCVSVRNGAYGLELEGVDALIHCAAIVHNADASISEYYKVNYELTGELAEYAADNGVKHFVFLSTKAVYGSGVEAIDKTTPLKPDTVYGKSKLKAEKAVASLASDNFKVTVLRPPMVYGKDCPGNYKRLRNFALKSTFIPDTLNKKSFLYVGNLVNFIAEVIEEGLEGTFNVMDGDCVSTADFACLIGEANNSKNVKSVFLGKILKLFYKISSVRKAFGTLYYDDTVAEKLDYYSIREAVFMTEGISEDEIDAEASETDEFEEDNHENIEETEMAEAEAEEKSVLDEAVLDESASAEEEKE